MTLYRKIVCFIFCILSCTVSLYSQEKADQFPVLKGPYLGQKPPGKKAEMFAPGIISTGLHDDAGPGFNYEGTEIFFRVAGRPYGIIGTMKEVGGKWTKPELAPFSGNYPDGAATFSHDEKKIYFGSRRPLGGSGEPSRVSNIWVLDRSEDGIGIPRKLGHFINTSDKDEYLASVAASGNLYFQRRTVNEGKLLFETFCSKFINGELTEPELINLPVDPELLTIGGVVDPNETYMLVTIRGMEGGFGAEDIYVCFRKDDGTWDDPVNLGANVNSDNSDWMPRITRDGRYLFFVSWRYEGETWSEKKRTFDEIIALKKGPMYGWGADIYWVDTKVIDQLKPDYLK
ncbi:hypothetical protein ACFL4T_04125 [candidate division KSB1 bacterium]